MIDLIFLSPEEIAEARRLCENFDENSLDTWLCGEDAAEMVARALASIADAERQRDEAVALLKEARLMACACQANAGKLGLPPAANGWLDAIDAFLSKVQP